MTVLQLLIIVPKSIANEKQIQIAAGTVETVFKLSADIDVKYEVQLIDNHDGNVYRDAQFHVEFGHIAQNMNHLRDLAWQYAQSKPRNKYVLFLCSQVMDRDQHSNTLVARNSNGATLTGEGVSFIAVQRPKSTVGDGDGQTWAHEIGHGLGLDHFGDVTNLMHASRHDATGQISGWELTAEQIDTMRKNCNKLATNGM